MTTQKKYYLISLAHTVKEHPYITFWRPDDAGYCWPLSWAGRYREDELRARPDYYNNERTFPVLAEQVEAIAIREPASGWIDGNEGPVVQNNAENMKRLKAMRMV